VGCLLNFSKDAKNTFPLSRIGAHANSSQHIQSEQMGSHKNQRVRDISKSPAKQSKNLKRTPMSGTKLNTKSNYKRKDNKKVVGGRETRQRTVP
jgi:hypothetical protein